MESERPVSVLQNQQIGQVKIADNLVICDIDFVIRYGVKIPEFTNQIQQKVKNAVENMTGLEVQEVNLHITGVRSDKNEDDGAN